MAMFSVLVVEISHAGAISVQFLRCGFPWVFLLYVKKKQLD